MAAVQNRAQLFGFDLGPLGRDLTSAWRAMLNWPFIAWLWPKSALRLVAPNGSIALSYGPGLAPSNSAKHLRRAAVAKFEAVVLPEYLLLRTSLALPSLPEQELQAALGLQVQALSPFAADDLIWAYDHSAQGDHGVLVDLVLVSRKRIAQHLVQVQSHLQSSNPEIWASTAAGRRFIMLGGFGELRRQRNDRLWCWVSAVLVLSALALLAALALTPSVQLYVRYMQASRAMAVLQQKAAPVLLQREALVRATEQLAALVKLVGEPVPPLQTLQLVTQALPDDTSLLSLQIQGLKVNLSGQTANAATLMKQLGSTPGLHDVTAPTPATKPLGASRESFGIEFTLDATAPKATP